MPNDDGSWSIGGQRIIQHAGHVKTFLYVDLLWRGGGGGAQRHGAGERKNGTRSTVQIDCPILPDNWLKWKCRVNDDAVDASGPSNISAFYVSTVRREWNSFGKARRPLLRLTMGLIYRNGVYQRFPTCLRLSLILKNSDPWNSSWRIKMIKNSVGRLILIYL